jgi:hypothetical protein
MERRVIITLTVDDEDPEEPRDKHDIADLISAEYGLTDPTVWEWADFWADVKDGVIGPTGDTTTRGA